MLLSTTKRKINTTYDSKLNVLVSMSIFYCALRKMVKQETMMFHINNATSKLTTNWKNIIGTANTEPARNKIVSLFHFALIGGSCFACLYD